MEEEIDRESKANQQQTCDSLLSEIPYLASSVDRDSLIKNLADKAKHMLGADHIHIRVVDWFKSELELIYVNDNDFTNEQSKTISFFEKHYIHLNISEAISGNVFITKKATRLDSILDSAIYRKYIAKFAKISDYYSFLTSFGPVLSMPMILDVDSFQKPIGIINVMRKRQKGEFQKNGFSLDDEQILRHISFQLIIALRTSWLVETALWPLKQENNIEYLFDEAISKAIRRTGAKEGKIRFIDWQHALLVPGVIPGAKELEDYNVRTIGYCLAGKAAEEPFEPQISNNLPADIEYCDFSQQITTCVKSYETAETVLNDIFNRIKKSTHSYKKILKSAIYEDICKGAKSAQLKERLNLLRRLSISSDVKEVLKLLRTMITLVKMSATKWRQYEQDLKRYNSEIAIPIMFDERPIGVLNVHSDKVDWFTKSDVEILRILSVRISAIFMGHHHKIINGIQKIERDMIATQQYEDITEQVHDGIVSAIFLSGRSRNEAIFPLLYSAKVPLTPDELSASTDFGKHFQPHKRRTASEDEASLLKVPIRNNGLGWIAIKALKDQPNDNVFIVREKVDDPVFEGSKSARDLKVKTTACIPLSYGGDVYGLLYIHIKERHFFTELEMELLTLFAKQAAIVLKNIKEREDEDNYSERFDETLYEEAIRSGEEVE